MNIFLLLVLRNVTLSNISHHECDSFVKILVSRHCEALAEAIHLAGRWIDFASLTSATAAPKAASQ
jgi:hypothetical protein